MKYQSQKVAFVSKQKDSHTMVKKESNKKMNTPERWTVDSFTKAIESIIPLDNFTTIRPVEYIFQLMTGGFRDECDISSRFVVEYGYIYVKIDLKDAYEITLDCLEMGDSKNPKNVFLLFDFSAEIEINADDSLSSRERRIVLQAFMAVMNDIFGHDVSYQEGYIAVDYSDLSWLYERYWRYVDSELPVFDEATKQIFGTYYGQFCELRKRWSNEIAPANIPMDMDWQIPLR